MSKNIWTDKITNGEMYEKTKAKNGNLEPNLKNKNNINRTYIRISKYFEKFNKRYYGGRK